MKIPAAALAAAFAPCLAHAFSFDDVHFWAGEGTNRAVVVVDWNQGTGTSLVWGFRWNGGPVPARIAVEAVSREDNRLFYAHSTTKYGTSVDGFGYDRGDIAATFDLAAGLSTDADALVGVYAGPFYWAQSPGTGDSFEACAWTYGGGVDYDFLSDGSWYALKFTNWQAAESSDPATEPAAAESPYAWRVVEADVDPDQPSWDGAFTFGDPSAALGRPSLSTIGWGDVPDTPVVPVNPAYGPNRLVSLVSATNDNAGGSITVEFDHDVVDDPRNPFGLDFIVFGNAMQTIGGGVYWNGTEDPATVVVATDAIVAERGLVEVSTDNAKWFAYTNGPYADDFAPTLSYRYNPGDPDPSLFEGNLWWGSPADATRPVDPAVSGAEFKGRSLAEYARLYDGSAGGTGFDISGFDLPRDAQGRKFIRFVRITTCEPGDDTEVDAVSDVAPTPSFRNWVDKHVAFENRPGFSPTNLCANGAPAFVNAAFGHAPDDPAPGAWSIEGFDPATRTLVAPFAPFASDLVFLRSSTTLSNAAWSVSLPLWTGTNALGRPLLRAQTPEAAAEFFRLELHE